jgi:cardiolipin synthase C
LDLKPGNTLSRIRLLVPSRLGMLLLSGCLSGCHSLPKARPEWNERQKVATEKTTWAQTVGVAVEGHPGFSGIELLPYGLDAFSARMALADTAERSLDLQYYMWVPDDTGRLLAERVLRAADRGVRVRLLLDDVGGSASDKSLLALSSHTNIEVRIFNPIANRTFRLLSMLFDLNRITRRMHNKAFTADSTVTILGGRNVADRYFGLGDEPRFADLEVIAAGPAVGEVSVMFERFWYSPSAIPIQALTRKQLSPTRVGQIRAGLVAQAETIATSAEFKPLEEEDIGARIRRHELSLAWGPVKLVCDQPEKVTIDPGDTSMLPEVREAVAVTERELLIVSPYFIPGDHGVAFLHGLRERGVRVVVLTSSLAANDVPAVHVGYRRYRKPLLRAGVELWEMKPNVHIRAFAGQKYPLDAQEDNHPGSSLHTKAFIFDRQTLFVGSLNLDPRSVRLNTEMGLMIEIPKLAEPTAEQLEQKLAQNAYRLKLAPGQSRTCEHLVWVSREGEGEVHYTHEPQATLSQRLMVNLLSWLPIESQL